MYLNSLELLGFKSFAKKTKLSFKTPVTAIVGPNGSGKSNVVEAFRFVLGEQRMTQMRSKRTEDLIWNGSQQMSRASRASAKLTFDNSTQLFDVDFDEVELERVIHRDASTDYRLNGNSVRLKDIVELLSGAHIGSSGHHIISQGETDRILLVNPKERKGMVEDALGLKVYQYKKQESERKLERTEQHRKEVMSLRRELAPHLKFLKSQVEKIEKARTMREELRELYKKYFSAEKTRLDTFEKEYKERSKPLHDELTTVAKELVAARQTLAELENKDETSESLLSLEKELSEIRGKKEGFAREIGQLEGELRVRKSVGDTAGNTVPAEDIIALHGELEDTFTHIEAAEDIDTLKQLAGRIRERFSAFIRSVRGGEEQGDTTYAAVESRKEEKERKLESVVNHETELAKQYEDLKQKIEKEQHSGRKAERAMFTLSSKENELRMQLTEIERDEDKRREDELMLEEEQREAIALVGALETDKNQEMNFRDSVERKKIKKQIERLKIRLEDAGTGSGEEVLREYEETVERDAFLERELNDLDVSVKKLKQLIKDLDIKLHEEFKAGVSKINKHFQNLFALMFGGGNASLVRVKQEAEEHEQHIPAEEGIDISVSLPRKKIKGLHMLSGGERALTSIALLFAMSQVNPPPFLVLDETDAALDEANSKRYGDMLESLAKDSQLIVITHNRETMSRAGVLYGVTMGHDGVSQLLSVSFKEAAKVAK